MIEFIPNKQYVFSAKAAQEITKNPHVEQLYAEYIGQSGNWTVWMFLSGRVQTIEKNSELLIDLQEYKEPPQPLKYQMFVHVFQHMHTGGVWMHLSNQSEVPPTHGVLQNNKLLNIITVAHFVEKPEFMPKKCIMCDQWNPAKYCLSEAKCDTYGTKHIRQGKYDFITPETLNPWEEIDD